MAANGKTPVERWTDRCLHRLGDEGLVFSGNAQNDWRGFESVICDEAELTGFDTVTKLADGVAGRSVAVPVTMQEFKMFLTGLKIIFPTNSTAWVMTVKMRTDLQAVTTGVSAYGNLDPVGLWEGLRTSLRRLSRADDTMAYWVKWFANLKLHSTAALETALQVVMMFEKELDKLRTVQAELIKQRGGAAKPSTLRKSTYKWLPVPKERMFAETKGADGGPLICERLDDPLLVLEAAEMVFIESISQLTNQRDATKTLADIEAAAAGPKGVEHKEELLVRDQELKVQSEVYVEFQLLQGEVEQHVKQEKQFERDFHGTSNPGEKTQRLPTDYHGTAIPEGDLRLLLLTEADEAHYFLKNCPSAWSRLLRAMKVPLDSLADIMAAMIQYETNGAENNAQADPLGVYIAKKKAQPPSGGGNSGGGPAPGGGKGSSSNRGGGGARGGGRGGGKGGGRGGRGGGGRGGGTFGARVPRPVGTPVAKGTRSSTMGINAMQATEEVTAEMRAEQQAVNEAFQSDEVASNSGQPSEVGVDETALTKAENKKKKKWEKNQRAKERKAAGVTFAQEQESDVQPAPAPKKTSKEMLEEHALRNRSPASDTSKVTSKRKVDEEAAIALKALQAMQVRGSGGRSMNSLLKGVNEAYALSLDGAEQVGGAPKGHGVLDPALDGVRSLGDKRHKDWLRQFRKEERSDLKTMQTMQESQLAFPKNTRSLGALRVISFSHLTVQEKEELEVSGFTTSVNAAEPSGGFGGDLVYRILGRFGVGKDAVDVIILVDTGAGSSAMKADVFDRLPDDVKLSLRKSNAALVSACGTTMKSRGVATLRLSMPRADRKFAEGVEVGGIEILERLNYDFIMGMPMLEALNIVIDCGSRSLAQRGEGGQLVRVPFAPTRRDRDTRAPVTSLKSPTDAKAPAKTSRKRGGRE
jgi:hypothetical protein